MQEKRGLVYGLRALVIAGLLGACMVVSPANAQSRLVSQYELAGCELGYPLDKDGAVQVSYDQLGMRYNPVTISQTALGCYQEYKKTGSSTAREKYLNQVRWLKAHYVPIGQDMAAYEYQFPWDSYGLRAGWRSGLAQGQAISALIRYHYDTGDASVLSLIRKLKNYMFLPRERGGVMIKTPEGGIWFEEYPSDPPSLVWNGNVSAVFGLYEFTRLFPKDTQARAQLALALASLKASLPAYDIGDWTVLDRAHSKPYPRTTNGYAIGHAYQLRTLAEITGDAFFQRAWLRWHSFYLDANFDALGNMSAGGDALHLVARLPTPMPPDRLADNVEVISTTPALPGHDIETLFDRKDDTYFGPAEQGETHHHFRLKQPVRANYLSLGLYNPTLYPRALQIEIIKCGSSNLAAVDYKLAVSRLVLSYYFEEQEICEIKITSADNAGQDRMVLSEFSLGDIEPPKPELPAIGRYVTPVYQMTEPQFGVHLIAAQKPNASAAMYRCAESAGDVEKHGWVFDMLDPVRGDSRPVPGPYCQFEFLSDPVAASAGWRASVQGGKLPRSNRPSAAA